MRRAGDQHPPLAQPDSSRRLAAPNPKMPLGWSSANHEASLTTTRPGPKNGPADSPDASADSALGRHRLLDPHLRLVTPSAPAAARRGEPAFRREFVAAESMASPAGADRNPMWARRSGCRPRSMVGRSELLPGPGNWVIGPIPRSRPACIRSAQGDRGVSEMVMPAAAIMTWSAGRPADPRAWSRI